MSFFRRLAGVFFRPAPTFRSLVGHPVWVDALAVTLAAGAAFSYIVFPFAQRDRLRTFADRSAGFVEDYGQDRYDSVLARIKDKDRELDAFVVKPLLALTGLAIASLVALGMGRAAGGGGNYLQVFSSLIHAGFVSSILGNGVRLGLILARGSSLQVSMDFGALFPGLPAGSPVRAALAQMDLFTFWMYGLFGLGLAATFKLRTAKGLAISYAVGFLRCLAGLAVAVVGKGFLL